MGNAPSVRTAPCAVISCPQHLQTEVESLCNKHGVPYLLCNKYNLPGDNWFSEWQLKAKDLVEEHAGRDVQIGTFTVICIEGSEACEREYEIVSEAFARYRSKYPFIKLLRVHKHQFSEAWLLANRGDTKYL